MEKCYRCGGERLEPGQMQSTGKIYFRPENAKFLTMKSANIPVNANICLDCGAIELVAEVEKAQMLTDRKAAY